MDELTSNRRRVRYPNRLQMEEFGHDDRRPRPEGGHDARRPLQRQDVHRRRGETEDGVRYRLDGKDYKSLSSAGKAITSGAINGWKFWSLADEDGETADRTKPKAEKPATKSKMVIQIRKLPNQKGVAEGQVKYFCSACQKSFLAPDAVAPEYCPQRHPRTVEDSLAVG